ncbi:hypothetical protein BD626DRAFT_77022 [Schizophyllum amplum]|uniref:Uncharacterized protein n=1 Tax=Schizophyllum amplum TaxID=97359 RepID=A0A550BS57_9AGAR|nr:hypothetical protein BD626DRAFT_77022 [Auriculariopsis ampla]
MAPFLSGAHSRERAGVSPGKIIGLTSLAVDFHFTDAGRSAAWRRTAHRPASVVVSSRTCRLYRSKGSKEASTACRLIDTCSDKAALQEDQNVGAPASLLSTPFSPYPIHHDHLEHPKEGPGGWTPAKLVHDVRLCNSTHVTTASPNGRRLCCSFPKSFNSDLAPLRTPDIYAHTMYVREIILL